MCDDPYWAYIFYVVKLQNNQYYYLFDVRGTTVKWTGIRENAVEFLSLEEADELTKKWMPDRRDYTIVRKPW